MIHSTESEFTQGGSKPLRASHAGHSSPHAHRADARPRAAAGGWSSLSFAEPEINSLWDTGLLDRLSVPLTRYHE